MSSRKRSKLQGLAALAGLTLSIAPLLPTSSASAAPPYDPPSCSGLTSVTMQAGQPVDNGVLQVSHVAGTKAGVADTFDLKLDAWLCNKTTSNLTSITSKVEFLSGTTVTKTIPARSVYDGYYPNTNPAVLRPAVVPASTSSAYPLYIRPGGRDTSAPLTTFAYPLPSTVRFTLTMNSGSTPITIVKTYPVADSTAPAPVGFLFPLRQSNLPVGAQFDQGYHDDFNSHNRYALDIGASRYDSALARRTPYKANTSTTTYDHAKADSWLMWGQPIYAMSDGTVISCVRGNPDNQPYIVDGHEVLPHPTQVDKPAGGNYVWIKSGNETQVYAHMQQYSISSSLCNFTDGLEHKVNVPIKAGQRIGLIGNSGNTSNPHEHIESIRGTSMIYGGSNAEFGFGADSRPMRFTNLKVQPYVYSAAASSSAWNPLSTGKVIPSSSLISPSECGVDPSAYATKAEVVQTGTTDACWSQVYNGMVIAGFRPVHVDVRPNGTGTSTTTVWRKADGTPWVFFSGLDAAGLQAKANQYGGTTGYRYLQLESYTVNNAARYAAIFVKQAGVAQHAKAAMSQSTFTSTFNSETSAGYRMVDYSVAVVSGVKQFSGLWLKANVPSYVVKDVTVAGFNSEFTAENNAGRKLMSLNGFQIGSTPWLATVWWGNTGSGWTANTEQTAAQIGSLETSNLSAARWARSVTEYTQPAVRFGATWRTTANTAVTGGPASSTTATTATLTFNSPDDLAATFECKLDAGAYADCASGKAYSGLAKGSHTFSVRARDFEGLRDASPATRTWTVA
jgi:hypothetical protein